MHFLSPPPHVVRPEHNIAYVVQSKASYFPNLFDNGGLDEQKAWQGDMQR